MLLELPINKTCPQWIPFAVSILVVGTWPAFKKKKKKKLGLGPLGSTFGSLKWHIWDFTLTYSVFAKKKAKYSYIWKSMQGIMIECDG